MRNKMIDAAQGLGLGFFSLTNATMDYFTSSEWSQHMGSVCPFEIRPLIRSISKPFNNHAEPVPYGKSVLDHIDCAYQFVAASCNQAWCFLNDINYQSDKISEATFSKIANLESPYEDKLYTPNMVLSPEPACGHYLPTFLNPCYVMKNALCKIVDGKTIIEFPDFTFRFANGAYVDGERYGWEDVVYQLDNQSDDPIEVKFERMTITIDSDVSKQVTKKEYEIKLHPFNIFVGYGGTNPMTRWELVASQKSEMPLKVTITITGDKMVDNFFTWNLEDTIPKDVMDTKTITEAISTIAMPPKNDYHKKKKNNKKRVVIFSSKCGKSFDSTLNLSSKSKGISKRKTGGILKKDTKYLDNITGPGVSYIRL